MDTHPAMSPPSGAQQESGRSPPLRSQPRSVSPSTEVWQLFLPDAGLGQLCPTMCSSAWSFSISSHLVSLQKKHISPC